MVPPWFYQVKRGEWDRMMRGTEKERFRDPDGGYRKLDTKEVAQAILAFAGFPGEAKDRIRNFLNKDAVSSISREGELSYADVYSDRISSAQLLLPAVIQRKVRQRVSADKATEDWLDYARFHIVWLIGDVLREHYQLDGVVFPRSRASAIGASVNDWFGPIYQIALAAIRARIEPIREDEEYPGHREFFRTPSNYRGMEANLPSAVRMSASFGNAMADLPA